jgi:hypothetical protein
VEGQGLPPDRQTFVIDNPAEDMSDEVVDPEMAKYEEEANRFAADTLIPPAELAKLTSRERDELTNDVIHDFAKSIGIGPGIVVGRLQHDGVLEHWQARIGPTPPRKAARRPRSAARQTEFPSGMMKSRRSI